MLARTRLPDALIQSFNDYADAHADPARSTGFRLSQEVIHAGGDAALAQQVTQLIAPIWRAWKARWWRQAIEVVCEVVWMVGQYADTPSPVHFHPTDLSGVLYLMVPEIDARQEDKSDISRRQAGYINFTIGGKQRYAKSVISFKPQVGDFSIFPGWLPHVAEPFAGSGERRSLSLNATVRTPAD